MRGLRKVFEDLTKGNPTIAYALINTTIVLWYIYCYIIHSEKSNPSNPS